MSRVVPRRLALPAKDRATCGPGSRRRRAGRPFSTEEPRWVLSELISLRKTETAFVAGRGQADLDARQRRLST